MYSASMGVEHTHAACAPSTATSDVLNHYTTEALIYILMPPVVTAAGRSKAMILVIIVAPIWL